MNRSIRLVMSLMMLIIFSTLLCGNDKISITKNTPIVIEETVESLTLMCDPVSDSLALIALYDFTNGANWINTWNFNEPMNTWYGVVVNSEGCVTCLDLDGNADCLSSSAMGNNLMGNIPSELGNMNDLEILNLNSNSLVGDIPAEIGDLSNLVKLDLSNNQISGSLPSTISNLNNLELLNISTNNLIGTIPPELGNLINLELLSLADNLLSGAIPVELGNLSNLNKLFLSGNILSGSIPTELGNLTSLSELYLHFNELSGNLPPELGILNNLTVLRIHNNQLTGSITPELGNLSNLNVLQLYSNLLTGMIPPELGNLTNLTQLYLQNNQLTGCFPEELNIFCALGTSTPNTTGYNLTLNPVLPFQGDMEQWCTGTSQIGAPCDDGDAITSNDVITASCECEGLMPTSIDKKVDELNIEIFPNPTADFFTVKNFSEKRIQEIEIIDIEGKVLKRIIGDTEEAINLSEFSNGLYLIKVKLEESDKVFRLLKE